MNAINPHAIVQRVNIKNDDLRLQVPFAMSITGPSQAGKSEFICNLIRYREIMFSSKFHRIIYCVPETLIYKQNSIFQKLQAEFPQIELNFGLPKISALYLDCNHLPCLLILDDLMNGILNSNEMAELFSIHVHHYNISVIFTLQNFFAPSRYGRTIARNLHYKVFFFNRIDVVELRHISVQIVPTSPNFLLNCFKLLEKKFPNDYSHYILIDGHGKSQIKQLAIRSNILPDKNNKITPVIFFPN
jgi:hypothetical protein